MNSISVASGINTEAGFHSFLLRWLLCGPFNASGPLNSCEALETDYFASLGGEASIQPYVGQQASDKGPRWHLHDVAWGYKVDLLKTNPGANVIAYAAAYLVSPKEQAARVGVGSDDGHKLWLNGKFIGGHHVHRGIGVDSEIYQVRLKEGVNVFLIKVEQCFGALEFCMRVTAPDEAQLQGLRLLYDHPDKPQPVPLAAPERYFTENDLLSYLTETISPQMACRAKSPKEFYIWHKKFEAKMQELLGPKSEKCPLNVTITEETDHGDYRQIKLFYDFMPGGGVPAYLLIPKDIRPGERRPLILNIHGHGRGKVDVVGEGLQEQLDRGEKLEEWQLPYASAPQAVKRGYIVFVPDFFGFGERSAGGRAGFDACDNTALWLSSLGYTFPRMNLHTIQRGLDFLLERPDIDRERVALTGHSLGGYMTIVGAAMESRIHVACVSGMLGSYHLAKGYCWTCGSQTIPSLLRYGDMIDIAALIAPRPLLAIVGRYDSCAPFHYAEEAYRRLEDIYTVLGQRDKLERFIFSGGHIFQPEAALNFIDKHLKS